MKRLLQTLHSEAGQVKKALLWLLVLAVAALIVIIYFSLGKVPLNQAVVVDSPLLGRHRIYTGERFFALYRLEKADFVELASVNVALLASRAIQGRTADGVDVELDVRATYSVPAFELEGLVTRLGAEGVSARIRETVEEEMRVAARTVLKKTTYAEILRLKGAFAQSMVADLAAGLQEKGLELRTLQLDSARAVQR